MSLDPATLSSGILAMLGEGNFPADAADAGQRWADAYATYAADARSPIVGHPTGLAAHEPALASALTVALQARDASAFASAMDSGLTAFWLAPPVTFSGSPPGTVTAVGGTGTLAPVLLAVFAANIAGEVSNPASADAIAEAIDEFTRTVIVTHPSVAVGHIS